MSLRVLIAGGGLGGLTLAYALRNAGLQPLVFERGTADADSSSSYRIHIDANGSRALRACLPADLWRSFERMSAAAPRGVAFATEQLQHLAFIEEPDPAREPVAHSHPISRSGFRQLLLSGLEDVVTFDSRVMRYEQTANNEVVLHLADGHSISGDVLVGADGSASAVRKQLLPDAHVVDTGVAGIAGKVYLTEAVRGQLGHRRLLSQLTMLLPPRGMAMFLAPFQRRTDDSESASELGLPEHLFWVLIGRANAFDVDFHSREHHPDQLQRSALRSVERWHPLLRDLVLESDRSSLTAVPLYTSRPVGAWRTSRVTLLGDAIHTMTPLQGLGGNTALMDAALLGRNLVDADAGRTPLLPSIAKYETAMRAYGFEAVQRSLQVSNAVTSGNAFGRLAFRTVLRVADHVPPLHQALFRRPTALDAA